MTTLTNLEKVMKKINVINGDRFKNFTKKQIKETILDETNRVIKEEERKPRAPRRGDLEGLEFGVDFMAFYLSRWQPQQDDIEFRYDAGTETGGLLYLDPGDIITLELKNVYINPRRKPRFRTKRLSSNGHGIWSNRNLKSRRSRNSSAKKLGSDLLVYNATERWPGAERFRGGNAAWKRWVTTIKLEANYSDWVRKQIEQEGSRPDDMYDPVMTVNLDKSNLDVGVLVLRLKWIEREEASRGVMDNKDPDDSYTAEDEQAPNKKVSSSPSDTLGKIKDQ